MSAGGDATKGALGGAATGATIGSVIPGVGTAVGAGAGALIGGLSGYFGHDGTPDPRKDRSNYQLAGFSERQAGLNSAIAGAQGVSAPQVEGAQIGAFQRGGNGGAFRAGQQQLIGQLQAQANGRGPSLADAQFRSALDSGVAAQYAQANSGRASGGLAGLQAAQNIGGMTQSLAGQAAQARMQEQLSARQQLAGVLGQARSQELSATQFDAGQYNQREMQQAGYNQQANLANQDAILRNRAQQQQYEQGLRDLELRNALAQQSGNISYATGAANGPSLGDRILAGGTNALAMGFSSGAFGKKA